MKYRAVILVAGARDSQGNVFTPFALKEIAEKAPASLMYDPLTESLICDIEVSKEEQERVFVLGAVGR